MVDTPICCMTLTKLRAVLQLSFNFLIFFQLVSMNNSLKRTMRPCAWSRYPERWARWEGSCRDIEVPNASKRFETRIAMRSTFHRVLSTSVSSNRFYEKLLTGNSSRLPPFDITDITSWSKTRWEKALNLGFWVGGTVVSWGPNGNNKRPVLTWGWCQVFGLLS